MIFCGAISIIKYFIFQFQAIFSDGVACVKGAPILSTIDEYRDDGVLTISKAIGGYPSHGSLYGDTFEVKSEANAINIAYTNVHLCPHQDLAYYESMVSPLFAVHARGEILSDLYFKVKIINRPLHIC